MADRCGQRVLPLAIAFLSISPVSGIAGEQLDLLVPVEGALAQTIREHNGNDFERLIFFTRRWRIVEVRPEVLCRSDAVRFNAFPDTQFVLRIRESTDFAGSPTPGRWQGSIETPRLPEDERHRHEQALERILATRPDVQSQVPADALRDSIFGHGSFSLWYRTIDESSGGAHSAQPASPSDPCAALRQAKPTHDLAPGVFTVSGGVSWPAVGDERLTQLTRYRLEPLECSPRYHVVYEHDSARQWAAGGSGRGSEQVQEELHELLVSLPADKTCVPVEDL